MIILISYLRARRFQWFKMNGFSCFKSFVCILYPKNSLFGGKNTPIIDCITHLLLMTLHSERFLIGRYPIWFTDVFSKSYLYFINHLWNSSCGSDFKCSKSKKHLIETDSHECATIICLYTHSEVKTNRPRASQICIGVIIVLSIKTQSLCDVLIGRELNQITPTANGRQDIL